MRKMTPRSKDVQTGRTTSQSQPSEALKLAMPHRNGSNKNKASRTPSQHNASSGALLDDEPILSQHADFTSDVPDASNTASKDSIFLGEHHTIRHSGPGQAGDTAGTNAQDDLPAPVIQECALKAASPQLQTTLSRQDPVPDAPCASPSMISTSVVGKAAAADSAQDYADSVVCKQGVTGPSVPDAADTASLAQMVTIAIAIYSALCRGFLFCIT